jgi:hypothetical protein
VEILIRLIGDFNMAPLMAAGLMALAGLAKSELVDKPKEGRQREYAAKTLKYSPWTGLTPGAVEEADPLGTAMQWGTTGGQMASNMNMQEAYTNRMNTGGSPIGYGKAIPEAGTREFPKLQPTPLMSYNSSPWWSYEGGAAPSETAFTQKKYQTPSGKPSYSGWGF